MRRVLPWVLAAAVPTFAQDIPEPKIDVQRLVTGGASVALERELIVSLSEKEELNAAETAILSASGSPLVLGRLTALAETGSAGTRANAIYGLGLLRDSRSLPLLEKLARRDRNAEVREAALHALSVLDERAGHEAFLAALDDPALNVRRVAAIGIALSSSPELWEKAKQRAALSDLARYAPPVYRQQRTAKIDEEWPQPMKIALSGDAKAFEPALAAMRKRFRQSAPYLEGPLGFAPPPVDPSFVEFLETRSAGEGSDREGALIGLLLFAPHRFPVIDAAVAKRLTFVADRYARTDTLQRNVRPKVPRCETYYPPALMRRAPTHYPQSLKRSAEEAVLIVNLAIDRQGAIRDVRLVSPTPKPEFAGAAFYSLRAWRFYPAVCDGERVESSYRLTFNFTLNRARPQMEELQSLPRSRRARAPF